MEGVASVSPPMAALDSKVEKLLRNYGCELIQKAGILLQLNAVTIATGQTILHKFYLERSLQEFDIRATAATACFLAAKLEENMRKVKDVARVFDFLIHHETSIVGPINHLDQIFAKEILRIESEMLIEFGFRLDTILVCPHRYVLQYVYALFRDLKEYSCHDVNEVAQRAWGYLNDSMRTNLCCHTKPGVIAAGCIYMAATSLGIPLSKESRWFSLFDAQGSDIVKVCGELDDVYMMGKPQYFNVSGVKYFSSPKRTDTVSRDRNRSRSSERSHLISTNKYRRSDDGSRLSNEGSKNETRTKRPHDHHHQGGNHTRRSHDRGRSEDLDYHRDGRRDRMYKSRHGSSHHRESRGWNDVREDERYGGRGPSPFNRPQDRRRYPEARGRLSDHHSSRPQRSHKSGHRSHSRGEHRRP